VSDYDYRPGHPFPGVQGRTVEESTAAWPSLPTPPDGAPNVVLFVLDDVGFAQPSPFGGWCEMPTLDRLAGRGLRFANFHATPLCSPTRACLLSGRNHHTVGMGSLAELTMGFPGYHATAGPEHAFLPAVLRESGWNTFAVGKWHLSPAIEQSAAGPFRTWPLGRGFERFYGFMGGDTSQWFPELVQDNSPVGPPARPEDGYHLNADIADRAISFIRDAHVAAPDKPFFLYYATGAGHAPHHVEPEWVEPYRGRFDRGWDLYREDVFARQVEEGLVPPHTKLSTRDPDVPAWEDLSDDARRMFIRQMEVYAGFMTQTDHHFGRVLDFVDHIGELDNTLVIAISDNGASAEGGPEGTFNEALFFSLVPERLEDNLVHFDGWGGVDTFPHYAWGWAWAGTTPFRRWKRETYRGGVAEPCIVSWPAGIPASEGGGIRTQYGHAIDMLPTVLEAAGLPLPEEVAGVTQRPFHGTSLAGAFTRADADAGRTTQYFEMNGYRAIYHDGWRAVCPFGGPSLAEAGDKGRDFRLTALTPELLEQMDAEEWELFHVEEDPAETTDLAADEPERLQEMIELWYAEAERYDVLPIASPAARATGGRPRLSGRRHHHVLYPGAAPLAFTVAPRMAGRAHAISAEVTIPDGGAEGILLAQGSRHIGFAFYLHEGHLCHQHNYVGLERFTVRSGEPVPAGRRVLRYEFEPTGQAVDLFAGKGTPGRSKLYVDGELVAALELPYTLLASLGFYGMSCGYSTPDPVDPSQWTAPFTCTAEIDRVVLDTSGELTHDPEIDLNQVLARQ
jgi:arylsulfatase A-like enzyme